MICKHCAYPNDPQDRVCGKCNRSLYPSSDEQLQMSETSSGQLQPNNASATLQPSPDRPIHEPSQQNQTDKAMGFDRLLQACLDQANHKVQSGDLRAAFLICQAFVMDHYGDLPEQAMLSLYTTMGKISKLQGKDERASKYLQKADMIRAGFGPTGIPARISLDQVTEPAHAQPDGREPAYSSKKFDGIDEMEDIDEPIELGHSFGLEPEQASIQAADDQQSFSHNGSNQESAWNQSIWTAGFFVRLISFVADTFIVTVVVVIMALLSSAILDDRGQNTFQLLLDQPSTLLLGWMVWMMLLVIYHFIYARYGGQSIGKAFFKIRIVDLDGGDLSTKKAACRSLGLLAAGLPALGGFFWAGFDIHRRGFHDYLGGTMVVQITKNGKKRLGIF